MPLSTFSAIPPPTMCMSATRWQHSPRKEGSSQRAQFKKPDLDFMQQAQAGPVRRGGGGKRGAPFLSRAEKGVQTTQDGPGNYDSSTAAIWLSYTWSCKGKNIRFGGEKAPWQKNQSQDRTPWGCREVTVPLELGNQASDSYKRPNFYFIQKSVC